MRTLPATGAAPKPAPTRPQPDPLRPLLGGFSAAVASGLVMVLLRSTLQVRSIPERLLEWALLFVSPDLFEAFLRQFGFDAKRYALNLAIFAMLLLLAALGAFALRRGWSVVTLIGLGVGLWLFTMIVIMPLTSAGLFAFDLLDLKRATIGGYLAAGLTYAAVLSLVRISPAFAPAPDSPAKSRLESPLVSRRLALGAGAGALVSLIGTYAAALLLPKSTLPTIVTVQDPQQPVPSGGLDAPNPHPNVIGEPQPDDTAQAPAAPSAPNSDMPAPPPPRALRRDQDGAVLPSGRAPGTLAPLITPNPDFYIVTKNAGGDPQIRPEDWRLVVDGEVERPFQLDYTSLRRLPSIEITKTLECISNFAAKCELAPYGCDLISTARWRGVRLRDVLALVGGVKPNATALVTISADEFTSELPLSAALADDTLLVYEMNGQVLPMEHGYPARVLVADRYGMKNPKWVVALRLMQREYVDWYGQRNWSRQAIVKTMTRIDQPARGAELPAGTHRIAGVAYGGARGIAQVEFSSDGGATWETASLVEPPLGRDTLVRWQGEFSLAAGQSVTLMARSTDGAAELQPDTFNLPQPDGSTGWPSIEVKAR